MMTHIRRLKELKGDFPVHCQDRQIDFNSVQVSPELVSTANCTNLGAALDTTKFGLDFWVSSRGLSRAPVLPPLLPGTRRQVGFACPFVPVKIN